MLRRLLILASLPYLLTTSCKQDESAGPGPEGKHDVTKSTVTSGTPAEIPDVESPTPAPLDPKRFTVAVALIPNQGSKPWLVSGIMVAPYGQDEDTIVTCLSPGKTKPRSAYIWSERASGGRWVRSRVLTFVEKSGLVMLTPGTRLECELTDLTQLPALPQSATRVVTVAWGEPLEQKPESPQEAENRVKQREMQSTYVALLQQERELKELIRRYRSRSRESRQERDERQQALSDLGQKIRNLRREAGQLGFTLRRAVTDSMPAPKRQPEFQVRHTDIAVPAGTAEATAELILTGPTDWDGGGQVPGIGLARAHADGLEVVTLATLRDVVTPSIEDVTAWFSFSRRQSPSLNVTLRSSSVLSPPSKLQLLISPGTEPPTDPETAPFKPSGHHRGDNTHTTTFDTRKLEEEAPSEFQCLVSLSRNNRILDSRKFSFSLRKDEAGVLAPEWGETSDLRLEAPSEDSDLPTAELLAELRTDGRIVHVLQTGNPRYLIVVQTAPNRIRVLDIKERQWANELAHEKPDQALHAATNAKHLFTAVANSATVQSYTIPELEPVNSQTLDKPVKALAAASATTDSPLLVAHAEGIRLLDPVTLTQSSQIISHGDYSDKTTGFGEVSWPTHRLEPVLWELVAAPNGDRFIAQLHAEEADGHRPSKAFTISPDFPSWRIGPGAAAHFGPIGRAFSYSSYRNPKDNRTLQPAGASSSNPLLPAPNGAMIQIKLHRSHTLPLTPVTLLYHRSQNDGSPFTLRARAGAWLNSNPRTPPRFAPVFVDPAEGLLIAAGSNFIIFEKSPELADAIILKKKIPVANRGRAWNHQILDANDDPLPIRILEGPENARTDGNRITWNVPGNFPTQLATFKISLGDNETPVNLTVPVTGLPLSTLHVNDEDEIRPLEPPVLFQFEGGIDRILPGPNHERAYVISGGCRQLTLINLKKMERGPTYSCPTGICSFAIHPSGAIAWHLDGNIIERLGLDDLAPVAISTAQSPIPLAALVSGTSPETGPPVAIFNGVMNNLVFRELNPDTFQLGTPAVIENLRQISSHSLTPTAYLPTSDDGLVFWINDNRITRTGPGKFASKHLSTSSSRSPTTCTGDGLTYLVGTDAFDHQTDRKWSLNLGENTTTYLFRDFGNRYILGGTQWRDQNREYQYRLHLINSETRESKYRIEGLPEWRNERQIMTNSAVRDCNVQLYTPAKAVLTISPDRFLLFARRLPIELEQ